MYWPGYEPDDSKKAMWIAWVAERPPAIREVAGRFDPWTMYRLITTQQRCQIVSFSEHDDPKKPVTITAYCEHAAMGPIFGRQVFGLNPDHIVPWEPGDEHRWEERDNAQQGD